MKTIKINLYQFDELSPEAKEKAREWYRDGQGYDFLNEYMHEFIAEKLALQGFSVDDLNVYYSLTNCQGDGVSFTARLIKGLDAYEVNRNNSNYTHEMTISEVYYEDENGEQVEQLELLNTMRDIAKQAEKAGYKYIDSENSNENVDENIRINKYTFEADGTRY